MHNRTKIKLFRILLHISWIPSALLFWLPVQFMPRFRGRHFFLFDRYALGGAQRINFDILASIADQSKRVWFTRRSLNAALREEFYRQPNTRCSDIHFWCDNLLLRLFTVHWMAFYLNRHRGAHVFGCNSTFFYDLLPFLRPHLRTTELLHNFTYGDNGMEWFGLMNHRHLSHRLTADAYTLANFKRQYREWNVAEEWDGRLGIIETGVRIPSDNELAPQPPSPPLQVLYAGRGGPQKRVWLIDRIARAVQEAGLPIQFQFAGDMTEELSEGVKEVAVLHGIVSSEAEMYRIYSGAHVLLMTSAYEGFPMAIKEAMACGCVPVVTGLEGNRSHLSSGKNAMLIEAIDDEERVVVEAVEHLTRLARDPELLRHLSGNASRYAHIHFDVGSFREKYRQFFLTKESRSLT